MAEKFNIARLTDTHREHQIVEFAGQRKFYPVEQLINDSDRHETIRVTPSSSIPSTALQTGAGKQDIILPKDINYVLGQTLKFTVNNTSATAATTQILTITPYNNTDGGASTPDGENYFLCTPYGSTTSLAYNATAATIQAALRAINSRYASVTVSGTMVTAVAVTMTGISATSSPAPNNSNVEIWGVSAGINDGGVGAIMETTVSTAYDYGDTVKLVHAYELIRNIQLNIGEVDVDEIEGTHLWLNTLALHNDEELSRLANVGGFSSSTLLSNAIIAPGGSSTFYVKFDNLLNLQKIPIRNFPGGGRFHYEIEFHAGSGLLETLTGSGGLIGDVTITNLELILDIVKLPEELNYLERHRMSNVPHDWRYLRHRFTTIESTAYTASQSTRKKFSFDGYLNSMYIFPRLTTVVTAGVDRYFARELETLEVEDNGGKSISGNYDITSDYLRNVSTIGKYRSSAFTTMPLYIWFPSKRPITAKAQGSNLGHHKVTTNEFLKFATANTETETIDLYAEIFRDLSVSPDGRIKVT